MLDLFLLILPLYLLMLVGFVAIKTKLLPQDAIPTLGGFVLNIAMPALMINSFMSQDISESLNLGYLLAYAIGSLVVFGALALVFSLVLRKPFSHAIIAGFGSSTSNTGFVGLPVVTMVFGTSVFAAVSMTILVESLLMLPLALILAEAGQQKEKKLLGILRDTLRNLTRSPLLIAIVSGSILSALGIRFPEPVVKTIGLLGGSAIPCALMIIGGVLATTKSTGINLQPAWISISKLALHPAAMALAFLLFPGVPEEMRVTGIVLAASPMLTIYPIIGSQFNLQSLCATALIIATTLSFLTITVTLTLVGRA
jgi:malonate transporter